MTEAGRYYLRKATKDDLALLQKWRSRPQVVGQ